MQLSWSHPEMLLVEPEKFIIQMDLGRGGGVGVDFLPLEAGVPGLILCVDTSSAFTLILL